MKERKWLPQISSVKMSNDGGAFHRHLVVVVVTRLLERRKASANILNMDFTTILIGPGSTDGKT